MGGGGAEELHHFPSSDAAFEAFISAAARHVKTHQSRGLGPISPAQSDNLLPASDACDGADAKLAGWNANVTYVANISTEHLKASMISVAYTHVCKMI